VPPFGTPLTPEEGAARMRAIERQCPRSLLVVGNVAADDWSPAGGWGAGYDWLVQFLDAYRRVARREFRAVLGVHCYSRFAASYCLGQLARLRSVYSGPMWVTEFGVLSGDARQFRLLLDYVSANFDRYAAYTNRQPHTGEGWELTAGVELVRPDGRLSPPGEVYAER
jgi:hypothetical protein